MDFLIVLVVLGALVAVGLWAFRTFRPEIDRARRIRRAHRNGLDR
ncbi:hypothetical protein [Micrococcus lacusdianchii]|nr:hypothetical protein [Micrococcus sp. JXJ CY 30]